jgi:hypothetical protein
MLGTMALRAEHFAVVRIEATFGELCKRLDMVDVKNDLRSATLTKRSVWHSTILALVAAKIEKSVPKYQGGASS